MRGEMSFQFWTVPVHDAARLFLPSGHAPKCTAALSVLAGKSSGSVSPMNQSRRTPPVIVARLMVHLSCANRPVSALMPFWRSVGMRSVTETGAPALYVTGCTSPVYRRTSRHVPWLTLVPDLNACEPVTYAADPDHVNSFEK